MLRLCAQAHALSASLDEMKGQEVSASSAISGLERVMAILDFTRTCESAWRKLGQLGPDDRALCARQIAQFRIGLYRKTDNALSKHLRRAIELWGKPDDLSTLADFMPSWREADAVDRLARRLHMRALAQRERIDTGQLSAPLKVAAAEMVERPRLTEMMRNIIWAIGRATEPLHTHGEIAALAGYLDKHNKAPSSFRTSMCRLYEMLIVTDAAPYALTERGRMIFRQLTDGRMS